MKHQLPEGLLSVLQGVVFWLRRREAQCARCDCRAVWRVQGLPVCRYHRRHRETPCPYCARYRYCRGLMLPSDAKRARVYCCRICALFARESGQDPGAVY